MKPLTDKQALFVSAYIKNGGNALQAAKEAGYQCNSEKAFGVQGVRLLANASVKAEIEKRRIKRDQRLQLEEDWEIRQLMDSASKMQDIEATTDLDKDRVSASNARQNAVMSIAKLRGKLVQKVEVGVSDELAALIEGL